ncbi:type III pantothenate kinase [Rasiella sp. SM2506]|uniref:type III pantothenate kinase n=1 Tax=Rasiella sp. SM2506 TaxID=3423914 RepID=UPI003D796925
MNLIVDVGNTRIKLAIFEHSKLVHLVVTTNDEVISNIKTLFQEFPKLEKAIVSSVGNFPGAALQLLQNKLEVLQLTKDTLVPFINTYGTPKTLGVDRIALVSAAAVQFPDSNVLVVDAGSCITYDFLTSENKYLGGSISPGIHMRYKALHTFTANLPLLSPTLPTNTIGDTTENSIHSGICLGVVNEIDGFLDFYREKYPDFTIILTGGDAQLLRDSLKNSIFAIPNFLLEGLGHILEHNT